MSRRITINDEKQKRKNEYSQSCLQPLVGKSIQTLKDTEIHQLIYAISFLLGISDENGQIKPVS